MGYHAVFTPTTATPPLPPHRAPHHTVPQREQLFVTIFPALLSSDSSLGSSQGCTVPRVFGTFPVRAPPLVTFMSLTVFLPCHSVMGSSSSHFSSSDFKKETATDAATRIPDSTESALEFLQIATGGKMLSFSKQVLGGDSSALS